jgi:hypothetical protein
MLLRCLVLMASIVASAQGPGKWPSEPSPTLVRAGAWRPLKSRLLIPEGADGKSATVDLDARSASYRVPGARYSFHVVVLHDPRTNKTRVMPSTGGRTGFYVSSDDGILAVHVSHSGDLYLVRSFVELPGPVLDLERAEKRFENEFDETKASRHLTRGVSMGLRTATGPGIFWLPGAPSAEVDVRADTNGKLLHLELANSKTGKTANLWIDMKESRIVRAIDTAGQERRNVDSSKGWITITGQLLAAGANGSQAVSRPMDVSVRSASFYIPCTGEEFSVAALTDPLTKRLTFIEYDQFFVSLSTGMVSLSTLFGNVSFRRQFFETPNDGNINLALQKFTEMFDPATFRRAAEDAIQVSVGGAIMNGFYVSGSQLVEPRLEDIDLSDGILHFVLARPDTGQTAAVWVDIQPGSLVLQRIRRAELGGKVLPIPPKWIDGKARLVTPGRPSRLEELREVDTAYTRMPFRGSDLFLAVVHDIQRGRSSTLAGDLLRYFGTSGRMRPDEQITIYVPRDDGLLGVIITANQVAFSPGYFVSPDSTGGPDAAIASFERSFDRDRFNRQLAAREIEPPLTERVSWGGGNTGTVPPRVDLVDLQGNTLRLVLTNPIARRTVTLWFDVNSCRLIRSSIGGP